MLVHPHGEMIDILTKDYYKPVSDLSHYRKGLIFNPDQTCIKTGQDNQRLLGKAGLKALVAV